MQILSDYFDGLQAPNLRSSCIQATAGISIAAIVPVLQFGIFHSYWTPYKDAVDPRSCVCTCWDTIFKGSYHDGPPGYQHFYFNITWNTYCAWLLTLVAMAAAYESCKHLCKLWMSEDLRWSMLAVFASMVYSHYYTWWSYVNAFNDDYYDQFFHQAIFSFTEILSTLIILRFSNKNNEMKLRPALLVLAISCFHILTGALDQFFVNVLQNQGEWHQQTRDVAFMFGDIVTLILMIGILFRDTRHKNISLISCVSFKDVIVVVFIIIFLTTVGMML